jgi:hypothetical protein
LEIVVDRRSIFDGDHRTGDLFNLAGGGEMRKKKVEEQEVVIHGFKGFDKDMKCRGFQFEEGKEYETDKAIICEKGFHFCENPLDVWNYYNPCDSEYAAVDGYGKVVDHTEDSKKASTKIKITAKLSLAGFIKASVDFLLKTTKPDSDTAASGNYSQLAASGNYSQLAASGDCSQLAASGDYSQLAASGNYSKLAASGDCSQLEMTGQDSVGAAIGINNRIKGAVGDWITLSEWAYNNKKQRYVPVCVKSEKIDGKNIKPDTWYTLKDGKFVEVTA